MSYHQCGLRFFFSCEDYPKREVYSFNALHSWRLTYHITFQLESPNEGDSHKLLPVNFMFLLNTSIRASGSEKKRSDIKILRQYKQIVRNIHNNMGNAITPRPQLLGQSSTSQQYKAVFMANTDRRTYVVPSFLVPASDCGRKLNEHNYMRNISENRNLEISFLFDNWKMDNKLQVPSMYQDRQ